MISEEGEFWEYLYWPVAVEKQPTIPLLRSESMWLGRQEEAFVGPSRTTPLRRIFALPQYPVRIGCASWNIPRLSAGDFVAHGSHLERYSQSSAAARSIPRFIVLTEMKLGYDGHSRCPPISGSRSRCRKALPTSQDWLAAQMFCRHFSTRSLF